MIELDDDFQPREAYAAIDRSFAEGWSDPKMDDYDRYEQIKRRPPKSMQASLSGSTRQSVPGPTAPARSGQELRVA